MPSPLVTVAEQSAPSAGQSCGTGGPSLAGKPSNPSKTRAVLRCSQGFR